jgi:Uma2 family endonuclease
MSIVEGEGLIAAETLFQPAGRLLTAEDLAAFPEELPSGPVDYELDNGRLVFIMVPPGNIHGAVQSNIVTHLKIQGEFPGHGKARTETGLILWRNADRVVSPDVLFIANKSLPIRTSPEGYLETIPELVIEVRSNNDSPKYLERKIEHFLKAGVEVVWIADPTTKTVTIHMASKEPHVLSESDSLELPGMIPGFILPVADAFRI